MSVEVGSRKRRLAVAYDIAKEQKNFKCPDCLVSFETIPALFQHLRKPHIEDRQRYSHLNSKFESETDEETEEIEIIWGNDSYACKICQYKLPQLGSTYDFHKKSWHTGGKISCPECSVKFNKEWQLAVHLSNQHGTKMQLDCNKCQTKHSHFKVAENGKYYSYHKNAK